MKNIWFIVILDLFALAGLLGELLSPGNYIWVFSLVCILLAGVIAIFGNKGIKPPNP